MHRNVEQKKTDLKELTERVMDTKVMTELQYEMKKDSKELAEKAINTKEKFTVVSERIKTDFKESDAKKLGKRAKDQSEIVAEQIGTTAVKELVELAEKIEKESRKISEAHRKSKSMKQSESPQPTKISESGTRPKVWC